MSWLFGSPGGYKQVPTMNPQQQGLMSQNINQLMNQGFAGAGAPGYQSGMGYLQDLYSQSPQAFARMQEPYMRQFQQQIVPGLAERFSAAGGGSPMGGGRQSSAFNQAMGQAGSNLSAQLGGMFEGMRSQNLSNLLGFSQAPYQQAMGMLGLQPFGYVNQQGSPGMIGPLASMAGMALGGPMLGAAGNMAGNWLSDWFKNSGGGGMGAGGPGYNDPLTAGGGLNF